MSIFANVLDAWRTIRADRLFPAADPTAALVARMADQDEPELREVPAVIHDRLARAALEVAICHIGSGEASNNCGPFVEMCVAPAKTPQNWCAGFAGFCYERAAARLGIPLPFRRSLGAKRLGENVAAVGRRFTDPAEAQPGDLMVFHRGAQGSWMGHVGLVEIVVGRIVGTVEGNCGPRVMRREHHADDFKRDRFAFFASIRR